ncbi:Chromate resistance protein ChrB [Mycobacterium sp. 141]|uniref:Chromate resistance protein ChrB n=1 Tax=Mycobacterium sp. 141 TaxID=1120797 RepID=UPI000365D268|nr:Chromate resistance protein ChrB [Mycobacterium sp. 141]
MAALDEPDSVTVWLLLAYRIPREPTRLRATAWRRLKALGAVYVQNSVAALPDSATNERALRSLRREIIDMGATAQVMRAEILAGGNDLVALYRTARDEEYAEIVDKCQDFLTEIRNETADEHFTYAELEENEEDLNKLNSWFVKIQSRDCLGAKGHESAEAALQECARALDGFANAVYVVEDQL